MFCHLKPQQSWQVVVFHSYKCQRIQTKSSFDEIISLSFDVRPLKVNTYSVRHESNLQRTIKSTHIIKTHLMGKK
jgi:hypothetical protein